MNDSCGLVLATVYSLKVLEVSVELVYSTVVLGLGWKDAHGHNGPCAYLS